jgi:hypothetical protein
MNTEINYDELKEYCIKIYNNNFDELKEYENKYNLIIKGILYNEANDNLKNKLLLFNPDYYLILINDFIKFIFEKVQTFYSKIKEYNLRVWFIEYKGILRKKLNINLDNDFYNRQKIIIFKLIEIKEELKQKLKEKSIIYDNPNITSALERIRAKRELELEIKNELKEKSIIYKNPNITSALEKVRCRRNKK